MPHWQCVYRPIASTTRLLPHAKAPFPLPSHAMHRGQLIRSFASIQSILLQRGSDLTLVSKVAVRHALAQRSLTRSVSTNASQEIGLTTVSHGQHYQRIEKSLDRLTNKDLMGLLNTIGLTVSGTKPVIKRRLVAHLSAIFERIDSLGLALPPSPPLSPTTVHHHDLDQEQIQGQDGGSNNITNSNNSNDYSLEQIKYKVLPQSIISIDIGVRNLAWVEVTKDGEILRWAIEDLLAEEEGDNCESNENLLANSQAQPKTTKNSTGNASVGSDSGDSSSLKAETIAPLNTSTKKKSKKATKPPALPFDSREVAIRLDKIMRKIFSHDDHGISENIISSGGRRGNIEGVLVERQRFRTSGMHAILDVTFRCGVIEGMIYIWLAAMQRQQLQGQEQGQQQHSMFVESISPRTVANWWGVGSASSVGALRSNILAVPSKSTAIVATATATTTTPTTTIAEIEIAAAESSCIDTKLNTDESYGGDDDVDVEDDDEDGEDYDESEQQIVAGAKRSPKYYAKKIRSRTIVDQWMLKDDKNNHNLGGNSSNSNAIDSNAFQVHCSPQIRSFYNQEKKRDDLSDALLQAVAWYEWRRRAIQEAVERIQKPLAEATTMIEKNKPRARTKIVSKEAAP